MDGRSRSEIWIHQRIHEKLARISFARDTRQNTTIIRSPRELVIDSGDLFKMLSRVVESAAGDEDLGNRQLDIRILDRLRLHRPSFGRNLQLLAADGSHP